MEKKWNIITDGRRMTEPRIMQEIFKARGITDPDEFLNPTADCLFPSYKFENIELAGQIVSDTLKNNGSFMIYFDSDTDGCTAGAIAYRYLKNFTHKVTPYINNGKAHGIKNFDFNLLNDIDTLIIVDAMEDSFDNYQKILDMGVKITVWDHHLIPSRVAERAEDIALVSSANNYPNPELSGSGVTWKVCKYLDEVLDEDLADDYMDLAAVGIIADMCSVGLDAMENRYICSAGFFHNNNPAIKKINGSYKFDATAVSFGIAPLINCANRVKQNEKAMKLFISDDDKEIKDIISMLKEYKEAQNAAVAKIMADLESQAESQLDEKCMFFFVKTDIDVAGLVANKLLERYSRPLFVIKSDMDDPSITTYEGSMRAIGVYNMTAMVNRTGLASCAGHPNAAGFACNVGEFKAFKAAIRGALKSITFKQESSVDLKLTRAQVSETLIDSLKAINRISGTSFKPVTVMIDDVTDYEIGAMSNGKHLKLMTPELLFIKWNYNDWENLDADGSMTAVGTLDSGFFGKKFYLQMIMNDFTIGEKIEI